MSNVIEYLQYPFFVRALVVGGLTGAVLSWLSGYIVLRREVLLTDALSNIGFLGIALAILLDLPISLLLIFSCVLATFLIHFLQKKGLFHSDSLLEIFAQLSLALAIIVIAFFPGYRINIEQFLFGDILGISRGDMITSIVLLLGVSLLVGLFHHTFLKISLSPVLSHTVLRSQSLWNALLMLMIAVCIAVAMKIIGVLMVAAFTTIPANAAKLLARNMRQTFVLASVFGLLATFIGLYASALKDVPSGAAIVIVLGMFWLLAIGARRGKV